MKQQMRSCLRIVSIVISVSSLKKKTDQSLQSAIAGIMLTQSLLKVLELEPRFSYYLSLTKGSGQGEQIAFLYKRHKASALYTERTCCRNSKISVSRRDCFSVL